MYPLLDKIRCPQDLKKLTDEETISLAEEIRQFLIDHVSKTGGHLSANLGVVELTLALHREFSSPTDQIIFDVGHQSYTHKMLTGRKDQFDRLRQGEGLSGFPKQEESPHDIFNTGHASTSISAALGLAKARDLKGGKHHVVAVIGDGAMTGGMSYEAMNQAGRDETPLIVVLNDNQMSIGPNVGALARRLGTLRTKKQYLDIKQHMHTLLDQTDNLGEVTRFLRKTKRRVKYFLLSGVFFEELGFTYLGPVDGHNLREIEKVFRQAKMLQEPVLIHVKTVKGKGYRPAERDAAAFHGVGRFDPDTGQVRKNDRESWARAVGSQLESFARENENTVVITAAMPQGTGVQHFSELYPRRFFDVGIAEEHAVTFAAGLARGGLKPYVVIYSTFLQRAYDQLLHDVCLQKLPVTFLVDHAGIVGEDGETHQGIFDLAYLGHIPNMTVLSPSGRTELCRMMRFASSYEGPVAIRYPKGDLPDEPEVEEPPVIFGEGYFVYRPEKARYLILSLGVCRNMALEAVKQLEKAGISAAVVDARFASGISKDWLLGLASQYPRILTVEDHVHTGGFGMKVRDLLLEGNSGCAVKVLALPDRFLEQEKRETLLERYSISAEGIRRQVEIWNAKA